MCIPELIFFDDSSRDRHSRRRGNALRPLSVDSDDPPPLLSSPPFVVQVSPKLGHHHDHHHRRHPFVRYQPSLRRSVAPALRKQEEMEWRDGFRAGRQAARAKESEEKKRSVAEVKKTVTIETQPRASVPEIVVNTARSPQTTTTTTNPPPAETTPTPIPNPPPPSQPSFQQTEPAPQPPPPPVVRQAPTSATIPAPIPPPAAAPLLSPSSRPAAPPPQQPSHTPRPSEQQQQHRNQNSTSSPYYYPPAHPRRPSPSSSTDSHSSLSLRALRHRLSALWSHITSLERRATIIDERNDVPRELQREVVRRAPERGGQRAQWGYRRQSEAEIRRAGEWEVAEEARRRRRGVGSVGGGERGAVEVGVGVRSGGSAVGGGEGVGGRRRVRRVVILDERRRR